MFIHPVIICSRTGSCKDDLMHRLTSEELIVQCRSIPRRHSAPLPHACWPGDKRTAHWSVFRRWIISFCLLITKQKMQYYFWDFCRQNSHIFPQTSSLLRSTTLKDCHQFFQCLFLNLIVFSVSVIFKWSQTSPYLCQFFLLWVFRQDIEFFFAKDSYKLKQHYTNLREIPKNRKEIELS